MLIINFLQIKAKIPLQILRHKTRSIFENQWVTDKKKKNQVNYLQANVPRARFFVQNKLIKVDAIVKRLPIAQSKGPK